MWAFLYSMCSGSVDQAGASRQCESGQQAGAGMKCRQSHHNQKLCLICCQVSCLVCPGCLPDPQRQVQLARPEPQGELVRSRLACPWRRPSFPASKYPQPVFHVP